MSFDIHAHKPDLLYKGGPTNHYRLFNSTQCVGETRCGIGARFIGVFLQTIYGICCSYAAVVFISALAGIGFFTREYYAAQGYGQNKYGYFFHKIHFLPKYKKINRQYTIRASIFFTSA